MTDTIWSTTLEGTKTEIGKELVKVDNLPKQARDALRALLPGSGRAKLQASGYVHADGKLTINAILTLAAS